MDASLNEFADALTPSETQNRGYRLILNTVEKMLHQSSYTIGRVRAGGSFGKETGISHKMDLDITFFLNGFEPPFADCLREIQSLIAQTFGISGNSIKSTDCSLRFWTFSDDIKRDVKVDLLPAINYVVRSQGFADISGEQQKRTIEAIKKSKTEKRMFRSSFTEAAVEFVKNQSQDVRQLVRLAKFWKDSVYFEERVTGVSSTIELIAVHVGIKVESHDRRFSMMKAFESFLKTMTNIANERIVFTHQTVRGKCRAFYNDHDIPQYISSKRPLVLDPVDPRNNRLYNPYIKEFFVQVLSVKAMDSLSAFDRARNCNNSSRPYLTLAVLWPGPFGSLVKMPKVIETPSFIALEECLGSRVTRVRLKSQGPCSTSEENWAKFLQKCLEYVLFVSAQLSLDINCVMQFLFVYAAKKEISPLRKEPNFYQHKLTIPSGSNMVIEIFIRWKPEEITENRFDSANVPQGTFINLPQGEIPIAQRPSNARNVSNIERYSRSSVQSVTPQPRPSMGRGRAANRNWNSYVIQPQPGSSIHAREESFTTGYNNRSTNYSTRRSEQRRERSETDSEDSGCFSCQKCNIL